MMLHCRFLRRFSFVIVVMLVSACHTVKKIPPENLRENAIHELHLRLTVTTIAGETLQFNRYRVSNDTLYGYQSDSLAMKIHVQEIQTVTKTKPSPLIPIVFLSAMVGFFLFGWYLKSSIGGFGN